MNRIMDVGQKSWLWESELVTVQENREMEAVKLSRLNDTGMFPGYEYKD